jgi:hypothetical protein
VSAARRWGLPLLLAWLLLAQTTRWASPWVAWISYGLFAALVTTWLLRVPWPRAITAWIAAPLSPMMAAAVISALASGGDWLHVLDLAMYATILAYFLDQRPDLDDAAIILGWWIVAICLLEWGYLVRVEGGGRVHLLGNSNVIAALLAIILPIGWARITGRRRWIWAALGLVALYSTGSRAGVLGLGFYVLARKRARWWVWLGLGLAAVAALFFVRIDQSTERVVIWRQALYWFQHYPLLGMGPGKFFFFMLVARQFSVADWQFYVGHVHAHNLILTWLAETGLVGLVGMAGTLYLATKSRIEHADLSPLAAIAPFFIVDDQTTYWLVALLTLYVLSKILNPYKFCLAFRSKEVLQ